MNNVQEETYKALLQHPSDHLCILNAKTFELVQVNSLIENYTGKSAEELINCHIEEIYGAFKKPELREQIRIQLDTQGFYNAEVNHPNAQITLIELQNGKLLCRVVMSSSSATLQLQDYYKTLFDRNVAGVYKVSIEGVVYDCNTAFARILGFDNKYDLIGENICDYYTDLALREKFLSKLMKEGQVSNFEVVLIRKDGELVWCSENSFVDVEGAVPTLNGTIVDVTSEKMTHEKYLQLFVGSADAILLLEDEHIIDCNKRADEIFGKCKTEWKKIGTEISFDAFLTGEDNDREYVNNMLEFLRGGERVSMQLVYNSTDGAKFHGKTDIVPFGIGKKNYWQVIVRDISERVLYEETIRESEERFRLFSEAAIESVLFLERGKIIDVNKQFLHLFDFKKREEIIGKPIQSLISAPAFNRLLETFRKGNISKEELIMETNKGKALALEVSGSVMKYHNKECLTLLFYDVSSRVKTEKALEQSSQRFRSLVENSPNGVYILTDGVIKYTNSSGLELMGFDEEDDLYNRSFESFFKGKELEIIKKYLQATREGEDVPYREISIHNRYGSAIDVGIKATLTVFDQKPSIQITANNLSTKTLWMQEKVRAKLAEEINEILKREIEEHKVTQKKLEEAQNYARNIIESSLDMIIAVNDKGCITEFNSAALKEFHYYLDEVMGKKADFLFARTHDYDSVQEILKDQHFFSGEIVNKRKDGSYFSSLLSASLIRDEKGRVLGSMGVSRDITEIREKRRLVQEQKAKLEAIFDSSRNIMMWTIDRNMFITAMNSNFGAYMKEFHGESVNIGDNFIEIIGAHLNDRYYQNQLEHFDDVLKGLPQEFEMPLLSINGKALWLQAFLNPVIIGEEFVEISCLAYDISDRIEIDRRIRDALKEKEVLLQEVHHRVKNNLQVISSILSLQSSYVTDAKTLEILAESQLRIKSMSFIHETLYRTSDFSSIDFSEYIKTLVYNLIQSYALSNQRVYFEPVFEDISLSIDQAIPCGLIVNELVSNALKYAYQDRPKGLLNMNLSLKDKLVTLRVKDDGVGLPSDFKYEEADSLGIQLVYTLVEQLDGHIEVKSDNGTEFLITFEKE